MMKIIFLCFVLGSLANVNAYKEEELFLKATDIKTVLSSLFESDIWASDCVALIDQTVDDLNAIKTYNFSELYQDIFDSVFMMYELILVKANNLVSDLKENDFAVKVFYRDILIEVSCIVRFLGKLSKSLYQESEFFDVLENAPLKALLITMFHSIFYATKIKIEDLIQKNVPYNPYPSLMISKKNSIIIFLKRMIAKMKVHYSGYYCSKSFFQSLKDEINEFLIGFCTKASKKFLKFSMSDFNFPLIDASART